MHGNDHHLHGALYSPGTQVVTLRHITGNDGCITHAAGSVAVIVSVSDDLSRSYRLRFHDETESVLEALQVVSLAVYKNGEIGDVRRALAEHDLFGRIIYRCIVGSRAYGLDNDASDTDVRGIYLPTADQHWSLYGIPEQLECEQTQEQFWELEKFIALALKANPNVLECLYSPLVETATPLAEELLAERELFLSKMVYQTFHGYVASQFKKLQGDIRNTGSVKWKHAMHLLRLLMSGITLLREGYVPVRVESGREQLLSIRHGEMPWEEVERMRMELHAQFEDALKVTRLPDRPDYARADQFLRRARRAALNGELP